ncbi:peroxiredoxin 2-like [Centruroides vittatus]|uniref:peroxiredoxin 2-like n=1 Tax=Centruroides vittatus TaxID=120091 RepID=UPI00351027F6
MNRKSNFQTRIAEDDCSNRIEYLLPNQQAPEFSGIAVINGEFKEIKLSDYRGKYLVFIFYPLDFSCVCSTELMAFSERIREFRQINCEVLACSTDNRFCHRAWINTEEDKGGLGGICFPLLADKSFEISRAFKVLNEDEGVASRSLFIIDNKGRVKHSATNDTAIGRSVDETLRLVQAFRHEDKHGELCPVDWEPGDEGIKPDSQQKKM